MCNAPAICFSEIESVFQRDEREVPSDVTPARRTSNVESFLHQHVQTANVTSMIDYFSIYKKQILYLEIIDRGRIGFYSPPTTPTTPT
ncbi:hypothetical protein BN2476_500187 [Paraburkholderia piptadeniae]|uniref:Uncharacterized protein n=1 Tax=Paraburkholderia piptadeniae TaxID=1701573 RepID=A0A1N7SGA9_9BURK|nr:hypothetical protein BN2476_500187 [Paraburkholderia piptadeniae]